MTRKTETGQKWVMHEDVLAEPMPTWTKRRVLAHGQEMMMVEDSLLIDMFAPMREDFL